MLKVIDRLDLHLSMVNRHVRRDDGGMRIPPASYFVASAVLHYLGPSFAVLLFAHLDVLGVAWLRIAAAAAVFALWQAFSRRGSWRLLRDRWILALGAVLAAMNCLFYLAIERLPLSTVGAIEFLGPVALAALAASTRRNLLAVVLAAGGVYVLTDLRLVGEPLGFVFAFANAAGFVLYVMLGHRIANTGDGLDRLGASMLVAAVVVTPIGLGGALPAFEHPTWLLWGVGVGICSSVLPYVADQLAMARLARGTYAFMLALLPLTATVIGLVVLTQVPTEADLVGIGLVVVAVALHKDAPHKDKDADELAKAG
jgi:inner membrane transporter RhtA